MQIRISAKCGDLFTMQNLDSGEDFQGYVPGFLGSYGDYVELDIDTDTGTLLNWTAPTEEELSECFEGEIE